MVGGGGGGGSRSSIDFNNLKYLLESMLHSIYTRFKGP